MTPVALPAMAEDLDAGLAVQQWVVAAYLLALGSLMLVGGALGDVYDRWRVFAVGTGAYGAAAIVSALAPSAEILITGRFLQGVAAALMVPGALSIITTTFEGEARSKAIGTWTAWSGVSMIAGPAIGGVLVEAFSWRSIYAVLGPLSFVVMVLIVRATPAGSHHVATGTVDRLGALLAVPIVGGPVFALIQAPEIGWGSPLVIAALAIGVAAAVGFIWRERRAPNPLVPFSLFRNRTFTMLNVVTFVLYAGLISSGVYIVLFLQQTAGYAPAAAGLAAVSPIAVLFFLAKPVGALADQVGSPKPFIAGGAAVVAVSMLFLVRTEVNADFLTVVLPWGIGNGIGLTLIVSPLTASVLGAADEGHAGIASGINNAVARVGSLLGIAMVGMLISLQFSSAVDDGVRDADLSVNAQAAVDRAVESPLTITVGGNIDSTERATVEQTLQSASVDAFRVGMGVIAGLILLAAGLTIVGVGDRKHHVTAANAGGGCLFGAHEEHA